MTAITQLVSDVLVLPSPHRLFPGLFKSFLLQSNHISGPDAIELVKLLVTDADHPAAVRVARIEVAQVLTQSYSNAIRSSASAREQLEAIRQQLLESEDGIIQALGFKM